MSEKMKALFNRGGVAVALTVGSAVPAFAVEGAPDVSAIVTYIGLFVAVVGLIGGAKLIVQAAVAGYKWITAAIR